MVHSILAAIVTTDTLIGAILSGGLVGAYSVFRKTQPEVTKLYVDTATLLMGELRTSYTSCQEELEKLNDRHNRDRRRIFQLQEENQELRSRIEVLEHRVDQQGGAP